jgi:hypothetical protein
LKDDKDEDEDDNNKKDNSKIPAILQVVDGTHNDPKDGDYIPTDQSNVPPSQRTLRNQEINPGFVESTIFQQMVIQNQAIWIRLKVLVKKVFVCL